MTQTSIPIPANYRLPLFRAVVDGSQAGGLNETQPALLVGHAFLSGVATAVLKAGGTGNGTIALDPSEPVLPGASLGLYKAKFSTATAFTVTDPNGDAIGTGTVGTNFATQLAFKITAERPPSQPTTNSTSRSRRCRSGQGSTTSRCRSAPWQWPRRSSASVRCWPGWPRSSSRATRHSRCGSWLSPSPLPASRQRAPSRSLRRRRARACSIPISPAS